MGSTLCARKVPIQKVFVMFSMFVSGSVLFTLYILTLSCCGRALEPHELTPPGTGEEGGGGNKPHKSKVVLIRDGDEDESRYQQILEDSDDNPDHSIHFRRKPLLEDLPDQQQQRVHLDKHVVLDTASSRQQHRTHGRRRHREQNTDDDTAVFVKYEEYDKDTNNVYDQEYDSSAFHTSRNRTKKYSSDRSRSKAARNLPQAIIIGVKKGGTRALLEYLRMHPDVRAPGPEAHFFDRNYEQGIEWYRQQMPPTYDDQLTIEKTPSYFVTKGVPGRIFNMSKNVKLLVVVRDPVTRAVSDYTQALAKRSDIDSFEKMAFEDNSTGLVDTSWGAIRIGVYAKHLERWLQYFPLSQMHFVNGEKLITDPAGEMNNVQNFLGLPHRITDRNFHYNSAKGFPCLVRPDSSSRKPHCLGKTKGREHPNIDPKVLQRLRDFFRPFNQKFYQMVGQDFGWS